MWFEGIAYAQAAAKNAGAGEQVMFTTVIPLVFLFGIFYFLLIRPQQRQKKDREAMLAAVKKGDRVVTTSGLHGTVVGLNDNTVTLKVADSVKLDFDRSALGRIASVSGEKESGG